MDILNLSASELAKKIAAKEISSREATLVTLGRIEEKKSLNAYVSVEGEDALVRADEIDRRIARGEPVGKLAGVPIAVKDNICVKGMRTTCASKMLDNFVPPYSATVAEKLLGAGAVIVGKANMDEFAMGSSSETSFYGAPKNPADPTRVAGGSSGGSAVAVASGQCFAALGTDTGGSIRQPASFCGAVGLKPTYGTVSRFGVVAYASSLDQVGPLTRSVEDAALLMDLIAGHDERESTSLKIDKLPYVDYRAYSLKGKKVAYVKEFFDTLADADVKTAMEKSIRVMTSLGAEIIPVSMPSMDYAIAAYYIIASAEAASNLARYDGVKYGYRAEKFDDVVDLYFKTRTQGFGSEVKRRIMLGNFVLSSGYYDAYYLKALKVQTLIKQEFDRVFADCDFIMSPTAPTPAFRIGEKTDDPMAMYLSDAYTVPVNIAGIAAISLPIAESKEGLPIGLQLMSDKLGEPALLGAAARIEEAR